MALPKATSRRVKLSRTSFRRSSGRKRRSGRLSRRTALSSSTRANPAGLLETAPPADALVDFTIEGAREQIVLGPSAHLGVVRRWPHLVDDPVQLERLVSRDGSEEFAHAGRAEAVLEVGRGLIDIERRRVTVDPRVGGDDGELAPVVAHAEQRLARDLRRLEGRAL